MRFRNYIKENKGKIIYTVIAAIVVTWVPQIPLFISVLTDDGYGTRTAPDDIEPPPRLK